MIFRAAGGCLRGVFLLVLLAVLVVAGWHHKDVLAGAWHRYFPVSPSDGPPAEPSLEIARSAEARIGELGATGPSVRVALSQLEVQSLMKYRYQVLLPPYLSEPEVYLRRSRVTFRARMPTDRLPRIEELAEVWPMLPDTTDIFVIGQVIPWHTGQAALVIGEIALTHGRIPLPRRLVPGMLERLGRSDEPGLGPDAIVLELPPGVSTAYVHADSLVLVGGDPVDDLE